jgi:uncharacterized membrane protein
MTDSSCLLAVQVDPLWPLLLLLRYMHIFGAIALMGATIFMRIALVPSISEMQSETQATFHQSIRQRWARWVTVATTLLLVSGLANLGLASRQEFSGLANSSLYNMLAGVKLLLALPIFFIAALLTGKTALAKRLQEKRVYWMNVSLLLAIVMVLMGGFLRFVQRDLKIKANDAPASVWLPPSQVADRVQGVGSAADLVENKQVLGSLSHLASEL